MTQDTETNPTDTDAVPSATIKSYRQRFKTFTAIPAVGRDRGDVLAEMEEMKSLEDRGWEGGHASGCVYHGDKGHAGGDLRRGFGGRFGEHSARHEDVPRLRARQEGHYQAGDDRAYHGACRVRQGGAVLRHRGHPHPRGRRLSGGRSGDGEGDYR